MKVALIGSRIGYIDRGFESFTRSLFYLLAPEIDITLFKGGEYSCPHEVVIPTPWCEKGILSTLGLPHSSRVLIQERTFAIGMLPHLARNAYDVIHFSEVVLGKMLLRLRRLFGLRYRLIFSNGAPAPPLFYRHFDLTQEVTETRYREALDYGIPPERLRLVPYGIDCNRFVAATPAQRNHLRARYGLPQDRVIVLCAAAIKRHHKRIDHLISEMGRLDASQYFLLVAGHRTDETEMLERIAAEKLGEQFRFLTLPHEQMHEMYQVADIFALPSLTEGLGIVILEAMSAALPVVVHNDKSFEWVVDDERCLIDMAEAGALARRLHAFGTDQAYRQQLGVQLAEQTRRRFDWTSVKADYLGLYEQAMRVPMLP